MSSWSLNVGKKSMVAPFKTEHYFFNAFVPPIIFIEYKLYTYVQTFDRNFHFSNLSSTCRCIQQNLHSLQVITVSHMRISFKCISLVNASYFKLYFAPRHFLWKNVLTCLLTNVAIWTNYRVSACLKAASSWWH